MPDAEEKLTPEEWFAIVGETLAQQPELAAVTVEAMQAGILAANDRLRERVAEVSMGLVEALNTRPGHVKRGREAIVRAIEASTVCGSEWAKKMIAKERPDG